MAEERKKLLGAQKAYNLRAKPESARRPGLRSSGIKIEEVSSQQARRSSHVQVARSSKDKGKAKMDEGAAFNNNGSFPEQALNMQKGLSFKDLDKVEVPKLDGKMVEESVAKLSDVKEGLGMDVEAYLQESVLSLMNKPTQGFELMDVDEMLLEMAMYEESKMMQKRDNP